MITDSARNAAKWLMGCAGVVVNGTLGVVPAWQYVLRRLRAAGFEPRTVFDIGVARGTPELYGAFPNAKYYLVDPTHESVPYMHQIAQRLQAEVLNVALGDCDAERVICARTEDIGGSSFFDEVGEDPPMQRYPVPVRRFDQIINGFERPALAKIDVQGAELQVLRGMGERIRDLDAIIVEASVIATVRDGPEVADVIGYMKDKGFVVYDMLGGARRPLDRALAQVDLLFVQEDSEFRADRRWRS
jgi:FkbM family methyltransferase